MPGETFFGSALAGPLSIGGGEGGKVVTRTSAGCWVDGAGDGGGGGLSGAGGGGGGGCVDEMANS